MPFEDEQYDNYGKLAGQIISEPILRKSALNRYYTNFLISVPTDDFDQPDIISCVTWDQTLAKAFTSHMKKGNYVKLEGYLHSSEYVNKYNQKCHSYQMTFDDYDPQKTLTKENQFYLDGFFIGYPNPPKFVVNKDGQEQAIVNVSFRDIKRNDNESMIIAVITKPSAIAQLKQYDHFGHLTLSIIGTLHHQTQSPVKKQYWLNVDKYVKFDNSYFDPASEVGLDDGYNPYTD